jgi:NTP pyrophosphatase (non-canonical NTP hydrolase)
MSITLWKPEPDVLIHQALGKLVEELGELTQIAARCIIQGFDASEPVTGISNRQQLQKEMSDVLAALEWASELTGVSEDTDRLMTKLDGFRRWQRMLEEDMRELAYQCDACSRPGYGPDAQCLCSPPPVEKAEDCT